MKRVAALLATGAILAGCGTSVTEGRVADKYYSAPYTYYVTMCFGYDSKGLCTIWMPVPFEEPEHWVITLENCDLKESGDDTCPSERWYVDQATYDSLDLGEFYDAEPDA